MKAKILSPINTPDQARAAAQHVAQQAVEKNEEKKNIIEATLNEIKNVNPELGGFDEIAVLLTMPEDQFALIAPVFLSELEKSFNNVNDQMAMVQAMNVAGVRAEDAEKEYLAICEAIDTQMADSLSAQKRDFIKQMLALTYNAVNEAEGVTKRHVLIPIEYCHPDAKMPTYAHLTDAGMDIYLTEDVTIVCRCQSSKGPVGRNRIISRASHRQLEGKFIYITCTTHEFLIRDIPSQGHRREESPLVACSKV